jgi:arsenate reductase (thioredoxin)
VMQELGIDISGQRSKHTSEFADSRFACVITVCDRANQSCPVFPGDGRRLHWDIEDPASASGTEAERLAVFRRVRDEIARRIAQFAKSEIANQKS